MSEYPRVVEAIDGHGKRVWLIQCEYGYAKKYYESYSYPTLDLDDKKHIDPTSPTRYSHEYITWATRYSRRKADRLVRKFLREKTWEEAHNTLRIVDEPIDLREALREIDEAVPRPLEA
jgi:hypothetical protein